MLSATVKWFWFPKRTTISLMFGIIFGHSCAITIASYRPIWSSYLYIHDIPTWDTGVCGLEVSHQILAAGLHLEQIRVGDLDDAGLSSGAASVHHPEDVGRAAHVVRGEAVAPGHPAVVGRGHQDHLAVAARGVKHIPLAVLLHFCKHTHNTILIKSLILYGILITKKNDREFCSSTGLSYIIILISFAFHGQGRGGKQALPMECDFNPLTSRPECMPGSRYTGVGVLFFVIWSWNC